MKKLILVVSMIGVVVGAGYYVLANVGGPVSFSKTATSTPTKISRTEDVKSVIDRLQAEREQDPTFIAETKKEEQELETEISKMRKDLADSRKAQSRLDALMIVQTQYDLEISDLQAANQLVLKK